MGYVILFFFIVFSIGYFIYRIAKFLFRKKPKENSQPINPYIEYHKAKMVNDENYEDYLEWMKNKEVFGTPLQKVEAPEDLEADSKVKKLNPR